MRYLGLILLILVAPAAGAKLQVVTTTPTLKSIAKAIGGERVEVQSIARPNQDPHYLEPKPSYILDLRKADLLVSVGLGLEVGWLGPILRGAKKPHLLQGQRGHLEAGDFIQPIEVLNEKVDRSKGDVHPQGNPHFQFDPVQVKAFANALAERFVQLDPGHKNDYMEQLKLFSSTLDTKLSEWTKRIEASGVRQVVTYHKSYNYFLHRFGLEALGNIEPLPGVPPTAKHIISLIKAMEDKNVKCILNENYFEVRAAERLSKDTGAVVQVLSVEASSDYFSLIDEVVKAIESCGRKA